MKGGGEHISCTRLTNFTAQSPRGEDDSHSVGQETQHLSWNPKVHYHVHRWLSLHSVLSQMNPVHTVTLYLRSSSILIPHLHKGLPSVLFPSGFLTKIVHVFLISPLCTTCSIHLVLIDMITLLIYSKVSFPAFCYLFSRRSKYSPQHPVLI
jgi:hypothetical protein